MTIRAIVFDIGNVLEINLETGWKEKWGKILKIDLGEVFKRLVSMGKDGSLGTCTEQEWIQSLREITGMSQTQTDEFMNDLWHWYLGILNEELAIFFADLRPCYQTAILSNSFVGARNKEQEKYHFHKITDHIIYSHEVGLAKPDKRIYELACKRLNAQPEEIIFVDDDEANITAALEHGIHGILYKNNNQVIADIQACITENTP